MTIYCSFIYSLFAFISDEFIQKSIIPKYLPVLHYRNLMVFIIKRQQKDTTNARYNVYHLPKEKLLEEETLHSHILHNQNIVAWRFSTPWLSYKRLYGLPIWICFDKKSACEAQTNPVVTDHYITRLHISYCYLPATPVTGRIFKFIAED